MTAQATPPNPLSVTVALQERSYDVLIGSGLLGRAGPLIRRALPRPARRAIIIADADLPSTLVEPVRSSLAEAGLSASVHHLKAREQDKTLAALEPVLAEIAASRAERFDPVIAVGGGIVGDMAGFAAAIYRRGVPFVQIPTTLLAMVDASVGGKTGVNLRVPTTGGGNSLTKNLLGSFHQPRLVVIDPEALASLPERAFRAGLAECLKHAMISSAAGDGDLWDWTLASRDAILRRDAATLATLVARNVAIKAHIVAGDEREEASDADGGRALLNLGHTFAHALESLESFESPPAPIQHGEAVALGLVAASAASAALGMTTPTHAQSVREAVASFGLPVSAHPLPEPKRLLELMHHDKKVLSGRLRLILPLADHSAVVVSGPPDSAVIAGWAAIQGR